MKLPLFRATKKGFVLEITVSQIVNRQQHEGSLLMLPQVRGQGQVQVDTTQASVSR